MNSRRLKLILMAAISVLWPMVARAEVCDKVAGDWWRPEHGPIFIVLGLFRVTYETGGLALLGILSLALAGWGWPGYLVGGWVAVSALLLFIDWQDPVIAAAVSEGCISTYGQWGGLIAGLSLIGSTALVSARLRGRRGTSSAPKG